MLPQPVGALEQSLIMKTIANIDSNLIIIIFDSMHDN